MTRGGRGFVRVGALFAVAALAASGCGGDGGERGPRTATAPVPGVESDGSASTAQPRLPLGLTEFNAQLLRPAGSRPRAGLGPSPARFDAVRRQVSALRPRYLRVVVDWLRVGADPTGTPALSLPQNGCVRDIEPCAAFDGVRAQLQAAREQQDAGGGWEVVVVIAWTPEWAALPPRGCERPGTEPRARAITAEGLVAYRRLIREILALGREIGVPLRWWSPYNEPNHPAFVSPQRAACDPKSPSLAPAVYARFVRAARAELAAAGGDRRLVLGELAGFRGPSERATGVGEFVRALPDDVACAGAVWSQHQYVRPDGRQHDAVGELERALDARPCTAGQPVWVTETGIGGVEAGKARASDAAALRRQCRAQYDQLVRWDADRRVAAVFQYTLRDDPLYPVALFDPGLTRAWPVYDVWRVWADAPGGGGRRGSAPPAPPSCAA
ncbi:hypothetical protein [Paraconexibacter sp.]|uniref:hypothetical protein n=1 Tax=Paraconexibacter sp. TaxID=2949640 RepID=UPI00356AAD47